MTYTIHNIDDDYTYEKEYKDLQEAIDTVTEYEKEDLESEKGLIKWYKIEDEDFNEVYNSLDVADQLLAKMILNK